ncbi:MAG: hypothetical protein OXU27_00235 [Candidatus Poribacteria bacterium]|nr:hypothetical protein [Candidatus Poribacteria bacterium]
MFRDILLGSRAIFIGIVFFVLVVGGSLLYSWHVHRTTDAELAETQRKVQPLKNKNEMHTAKDTVDTSTVDFEHVETDPETDDSQISDNTGVSPIDETSEMLDMADAFLPDDFVSEEAPAEDVPISPFGFGPYPEVPADYPSVVLWEDDDHGNLPQRTLKNIELIDRVLVKLWSEGERGFKGGAFTNGKVYPYYHNSVYVRYEEDEGYRYISEYYGGPEIPPLTPKQLYSGQLPAGIRTIDMDTAGIDAYSFLDF